MRAAQSQAKQAAGTAATDASKFGAQADAERAPLEQFDIQNLTNPEGFGQQGVKEMLTAALAGGGGATSSLIGSEEEAAHRNPAGSNSAVLDSLARSRAKAAASASEGVAASDVALKEQQKENAANDLSRRYGIDVSSMLGEQGAQNNAIDTEIKAGQTGWFQNLTSFMQAAAGDAAAAAGVKKAF